MKRCKFLFVYIFIIFLFTSKGFILSEITKAECEEWIIKVLTTMDDSLKIYVLDNIVDIPSKRFYPEIKKLASFSTNDNVKLKSWYVCYKVYKDTYSFEQIVKFLLQKPKLLETTSQVAKAKVYLKNQLRVEAARMLGELGDEKTLEVLSKIINSDDDGNVKDAVYFAIALLSQRGKIKPLPEMKEFFYSGLKDVNPKVRLQAVKYLGELSYEDAVIPLSLRLKDVQKQIVLETISSLGKLGSLSIPVLQDLLQFRNHPEDAYRATLAEALGNIAMSIYTSSEPAKIEAFLKIKTVLTNFLSDPNGMVRVTASRYLLSVGDRTGIEVLKKALESNDIDVVIYCIETLGKYGSKDDIKLIEKLMYQQDFKIKTAIYCSILKIYYRSE